MRAILSRAVLTLMGVLFASTLLAASPGALAPGEARYAVTLNAAVRQPDFSGLGGRVEGQDGSSLTVVLPAKAAMALAHDPAVVLIRELDTGTPEPSPAPAAAPPHRNVTEDAFRMTPLDSVTLWGSGQYVYDGAGNITAIGTAGALNSDGKVSTFTYDASSRLKTTSIGRATGDDIVETYTYDGFGNILQHVRSHPLASAVTFSPLPSPDNNRMTELGTVYDSAGNVTTLAGGTTLTYDAFNQVTSKTSPTATAPEYTYIYDVNEERIGIEYGAATHWTIRDFDNKPLIQFDGPLPGATQTQWTWVESFVWAGGKMVMAERPAGTGGGPLHYHVDHLGSTRVVTDANGQPLAPGRIDYAPFGEEITASGGELLKFAGHERDYDLSNSANDNYLDYMHARYYDSRRGRFLSVDPTSASIDAGRPQTWNRYGYVDNNPIGRVDPDGRCGWGMLAGPIGCAAEDYLRVRGPQVVEAIKGMGPGSTTEERLEGAAVVAITSLEIGSSFISPEGAAATEVKASLNEVLPTITRNAAQGKAAEATVAAELKSEGATILGSQVTAKTSKGTRIIDHLIQDGNGISAVEVKSGNATRNAAQVAKDGAMASEGATLTGKNAPAELRGKTVKIPTVVRRPATK